MKETKHQTGNKIGSLYLFGYEFEIYENVVMIRDNEDHSKAIEMQHHTFKSIIDFYDRKGLLND